MYTLMHLSVKNVQSEKVVNLIFKPDFQMFFPPKVIKMPRLNWNHKQVICSNGPLKTTILIADIYKIQNIPRNYIMLIIPLFCFTADFKIKLHKNIGRSPLNDINW